MRPTGSIKMAGLRRRSEMVLRKFADVNSIRLADVAEISAATLADVERSRAWLAHYPTLRPLTQREVEEAFSEADR